MITASWSSSVPATCLEVSISIGKPSRFLEQEKALAGERPKLKPSSATRPGWSNGMEGTVFCQSDGKVYSRKMQKSVYRVRDKACLEGRFHDDFPSMALRSRPAWYI